MNEQIIEAVTREVSETLTGARFGRVFTLSKRTFAIDMRLRDGRFLFVSVEPRSPRAYLIRRRMKELEKSSRQDPPFVQIVRKLIANAEIEGIEKPFPDRIVILRLRALDEVRGETRYGLVLQLTGRSANLFLLDEASRIIDSLNAGTGKGQEVGMQFAPPSAGAARTTGSLNIEPAGASISEALDRHFSALEETQRRESRFRSAESSLKKDLKKQRKLVKALNDDLENHGEEGKWKRLGELLLANTETARRTGEGFAVADYYEEGAPEIVIEADPRHTVAEAAERYFRKYTKARNARTAIAERLETVGNEIRNTEARLAALRLAYDSGERIAEPEKERANRKAKFSKKDDSGLQGVRRFLSRDGYEIFVGKRSKDNDTLTFRIARSLDTWMHAADYPGSHVVIRNPARKEIPRSTLLDAAKIAAFYSKARGESKAAVHYTLRKFVHKPKGAKPGLVSLAEFKTILVEPGIPEGAGT